ncbi:MAG: hypothetical protein CVV40_00470, partial [Planctomycetes bacterium HGW-Planctomycetes-2]
MGSVHWPILRTCAGRALAPLIVDDQRTWRGMDLLIGASGLAAEIRRRSRSATVGLLLPTGGAFPMAALAVWMAGRAVVPLNYLLKRDELQFVIENCETDLVLSAGPLLAHLGYEPRASSLLKLDELDLGGASSLRALGADPCWPAPTSSDDLAALLYTSGTSGRPKGVMLTHGNISANIRQCVEFAGFNARDVVLGVLPQFHSFGFTVLTMLPLTIGARCVFTARFVPSRIIRALREHRPTALIAIPSMFSALLSVKDGGPADFSSLRFIVSGGEPLSQTVASAFEDRFGARIHEGYGLTETSPVTNWSLPGDAVSGSVGRALPGVEQRIIDLEGASLTSGSDKFALTEDYHGFYQQEAQMRREALFPPFTELASFIVSGSDCEKTRAVADELAAALKTDANVGEDMLFGPAPASIERLNGRYRFQLMLKMAVLDELTNAVKQALLR